VLSPIVSRCDSTQGGMPPDPNRMRPPGIPPPHTTSYPSYSVSVIRFHKTCSEPSPRQINAMRVDPKPSAMLWESRLLGFSSQTASGPASFRSGETTFVRYVDCTCPPRGLVGDESASETGPHCRVYQCLAILPRLKIQPLRQQNMGAGCPQSPIQMVSFTATD